MKVFLTGGSGLLGRAMAQALQTRGVDFVAPSSRELDILDFAAVDQFVSAHQPTQIIHCAAYTAVDLAETEKEACWDLNVEALRNLAKYGLPIVHFSTDYVFNAPLDLQPIPTYQPLEPLNYYGQSKAAAEEILEEHSADWWNIRTTWLYGPEGEGFPQKIRTKAETREKISVINDQFGRKTLTTDLAAFVLDQLPTERTGHHHFQSPGAVHTWYDWAVEILGSEKVEPISTESLNLPAARPQNSVLV